MTAHGYIARRPFGIVHDDDSAEEEESSKLFQGLDELGKEMMSGVTPEQRQAFKREIEVATVKKNGAVKTFFTLMKGFIATAVLFLPKGFRNGGWLFSTIALICSAILTYFCAMLLLQIRSRYRGFSLSDIGRQAYGWRGKLAVDVALAGSQTGFVMAYVVFISENLQLLVGQLFGVYDINIVYFGIICFAVFTPLVWVRRI